MFRPLFKGLTRPLFVEGFGSRDQCTRWAYDFDGVDDFGEFAGRLIDPDGDIDIEFYTPTVGGLKTVIFQGDSQSTISDNDLWIFRNGNSMEFRCKGAVRSLGVLPGNQKFKVTLIGTSLILRDSDDNILSQWVFNRGSYSADNPVTVLGARLAGAFHVNFFQGIQRDIKINGHLYPIDNPASDVQLSRPDNGIPLTLRNTNPPRWSRIPC